MRKSRASANGDTLPIDGIEQPVQIRRHPAARRMTLRVSRTRRAVIVTLPTQCDLDAVGTFVHRHIDWVRERLHNLPQQVPFADGASLPLRGEAHKLCVLGEMRRGFVVKRDVCPAGRPHLLVAGKPEHAARRLKDWLIEQAAKDLQDRVAVHGQRLGLSARRIAVRDQSSRWGSCSTTGVLSFSWRLVLAPPLVLDYVAAHEVAHLSEMNHGPRFWALVRKSMPEMDEAKQWLRVFGMDLHRYG